MTASPDTRRPQHHQRASAHACPDCETYPLIIIFQHHPAAEDISYWFDCPNCEYSSTSRAVPSTDTDETPGESLTEDRLAEFVATIDTNPPF